MLPVPELSVWRSMAEGLDQAKDTVIIAIIGKYNSHSDAYLSVMKGLTHSCILLQLKLQIRWIDATDLEEVTKLKHLDKYQSAWEQLETSHGILVPGGFGVRGVEGKIIAAKYAREHKVPFLGVCLGMQVMVIEYARNVLNLEEANSTEFDEVTPHPVVMFMPEINHFVMGGTMRLGARGTTISYLNTFGTDAGTNKTEILSNDSSANDNATNEAHTVQNMNGHHESSPSTQRSIASEVYGIESPYGGVVMERHRHRYEVNPKYVERLEQRGLYFTGRDDKGVRMEIAELSRSTHPYYFGTQFHPEFKSRPTRPSPPFFGFVATASGRTSLFGAAGEKWQAHEHSALPLSSTPMSPIGKLSNQSLGSPSRRVDSTKRSYSVGSEQGRGDGRKPKRTSSEGGHPLF